METRDRAWDRDGEGTCVWREDRQKRGRPCDRHKRDEDETRKKRKAGVEMEISRERRPAGWRKTGMEAEGHGWTWT